MGNDGFHTLATRRRCLAVGVAWPTLAWMDSARAQANPPAVIGWLDTGTREAGHSGRNAFIEGMAALGWKVGTQYRLEERYAEGQVDRLPALAQEIAATKPAVIVAQPSAAVRAAAKAAPATPIVLVSGNPFSTGLVDSLARPGGMVTGLSRVTGELNQKVVELLAESLPKLQRVGFLADSTSRSHEVNVANVRRVSERFRLQAVIVDTARPEDIEPAMARLAKDKVQALVIMSSTWLNSHVPKVLQLAAVQRWPVAGLTPQIPRQGGLFSYAPNGPALQRRLAHYVDHILKDAKPGDLPIELPTTFDLLLNLKTAATLGIVIPPAMRVRATEVIE
jgi:putative ABC transport system substrate-binding protein